MVWSHSCFKVNDERLKSNERWNWSCVASISISMESVSMSEGRCFDTWTFRLRSLLTLAPILTQMSVSEKTWSDKQKNKRYFLFSSHSVRFLLLHVGIIWFIYIPMGKCQKIFHLGKHSLVPFISLSLSFPLSLSFFLSLSRKLSISLTLSFSHSPAAPGSVF